MGHLVCLISQFQIKNGKSEVCTVILADVLHSVVQLEHTVQELHGLDDCEYHVVPHLEMYGLLCGLLAVN